MRKTRAMSVVLAVLSIAAGSASAVRAPAVRAPVVQPPRGVVRTDTIWSQSLGTTKALTIYLPPSYGSGTKRYPLLVYLHGARGNERDWVQHAHLDRVMDSLVAAGGREAIIVMPDGDNSYYTTSPRLPDVPACQADTVVRGGEPAESYCVPWPHYDDYIARDIVGYMDRRYRTIGTRNSRGIAGLSMGGYGAVTLALGYPDVFAAAASHSGALSLRLRERAAPDDPNRYWQTRDEIAASMRRNPYRFATFGTDSIAVIARDPITMVERFARRVATGEARWPALALDVGVNDHLLALSRDFSAALTRLGVKHRYAEHPGAHTWEYWRAHVPESLVFLLGVVR